MRKLGVLWVLASLSLGCVSAPPIQAHGIREADEQAVEGCEFLGSVYGNSMYGNMADEKGIAVSKNKALEQARALGATHIVYTEIDGGSPVSGAKVSGRAYRCATP